MIIIPLLMLITFGGIEFGIGFSQKGALESASRAGAREGATLTNDQSLPLNTGIGDKVLQAVNGALDTTAVPELTKMSVYKPGTLATCGQPGNTTCIQYLPTSDHKHFDAATSTGSWPYLVGTTPTRLGCGTSTTPPDKISVQIEGNFAFLTGLVGNGTIPLKVSATLQFEPTDC